MDELTVTMSLPDDARRDIAVIIKAMSRNESPIEKEDRFSDSLVCILNAPPEATLMKLCDRIGILIDSADRNDSITDHYLSSTDTFDAGFAPMV